MEFETNDIEQPFEIEVNGILDLHMFKPSDLGSLIDEYIYACLDKNICQIRIIHGKGMGSLRRSVHRVLERNPHVETFGLASDKSSWGATTATLNQDKKRNQ